MSDRTTDSQSVWELPSELFLRILALLPPHDLALSGRLSCKAAAQRFSGAHHRTVSIDQPLPNHTVTTTTATAVQTASNMTITTVTSVTTASPWLLASATAPMRELTFRRKLLLLCRAAASGCAAKVEVAWQLLQPHVFSELLQSSRYCRTVLQQVREQGPVPDVGSAAVASGLAHLLPCLVQRCPGLLDPGRTLEAAARHCDLAGLQAAWVLLEQRLQSSPEEEGGQLPAGSVQQFWQRMLAAAARSTAPEAASKMEWVLAHAPAACDRASILAHTCGPAAASGDLARLRWLRERGVDWCTPAALGALLECAELGFIQRLEEEGGYLPAANDAAWRSSSLVNAAAAAPRDSEAKLQWLAGRGASLELASDAMCMAAEHGNLAALKLLVRCHGGAAPPDHALYRAAAAGSIATASWLQQAGCTLTGSVFREAFGRGDMPMVRWLLEAGSPRWDFQTLAMAISVWPRDSTADGERLVEAVRLLAAAGWPTGVADDEELVTRAARAGHPWAVWQGLLQLRELHPAAVPRTAARRAAAAGCQATLEALEALHGREHWGDDVYTDWYAEAAKNGDKGTLAWLVRQRPRWEDGVVSAAADKEAPLPALQWLAKQGLTLSRCEIKRIRRNLGRSSSRQWQQGVEAWLSVCSRRWATRLCLATVWLVCVVVVDAALLEEVDGGQFGFWATAAVRVLVCVVILVAAFLWCFAYHEAPVCCTSQHFFAL